MVLPPDFAAPWLFTSILLEISLSYCTLKAKHQKREFSIGVFISIITFWIIYQVGIA